jgi:hypothetical protein
MRVNTDEGGERRRSSVVGGVVGADKAARPERAASIRVNSMTFLICHRMKRMNAACSEYAAFIRVNSHNSMTFNSSSNATNECGLF